MTDLVKQEIMEKHFSGLRTRANESILFQEKIVDLFYPSPLAMQPNNWCIYSCYQASMGIYFSKIIWRLISIYQLRNV